MLAARFELAAYVNVNKPDNRQNANPRPRHPDARRDETATLTAAAMTALIEVKQTCLQSTITKGVGTTMHGRGFVYLSSHSRLTMPCCQSLLNERSSRSAGDATDGEADLTCRVSSSGNNTMQQVVTAYQPLRNRSWAPRRRAATPSKRYCQLSCSTAAIAIQSLVTHEKNIEVRVLPSPLITPRQ